MIKKVFCIYDEKVEAFKNPFIMETVAAATRAFGDIANDKQTEIGKHPEDFILYEIGEFNQESGKYTNVDFEPKKIVNASALIK